MVAAPKKEERATPARISPWAVMLGTRLQASTQSPAANAPARAPNATRLRPASPPAVARAIMTKLAPKAAP